MTTDLAVKNNINIFDPTFFDYCQKLSEVMANGSISVPDQFRGKPADCFAVIMKAVGFNINPYSLLEKSYIIHGKIAYEAQLIIALVNDRGPITGQLRFEWVGEWSQVQGKFKMHQGPNGAYPESTWDTSVESGLSVIVSAEMKSTGETVPLELKLAQAGVRNSTLWATDPRQQLAYLAAKRWASLNCPGVTLGIQTIDDIVAEKDITPKKEADSPAKTGNEIDELLSEVGNTKTVVSEPEKTQEMPLTTVNNPQDSTDDNYTLELKGELETCKTLEDMEKFVNKMSGLSLTMIQRDSVGTAYRCKLEVMNEKLEETKIPPS